MDTTKQAYHHVDLRTALLRAGEEMIVKEGVDSVTFRALSKRVGVSRTAPYRHFRDKTDLLCGIAEEGFRKLRDHLREVDAKLDPLARFGEIAVAYVDFAVRNPDHYRLMFGREVVSRPPPDGLRDMVREAFGETREVLEVCQREGCIRQDDTVALANVAWATVHGLAILLIDGQVQTSEMAFGLHSLLSNSGKRKPDDPRQLIRLAIGTLIDGLRVGE
jgi:AcrR family transcriptional regulator